MMNRLRDEDRKAQRMMNRLRRLADRRWAGMMNGFEKTRLWGGGFAKVRLQNKALSAFAALVLLLLFNLFFTKHFFAITVQDGHLFGTLIDILNRGAPAMLLAMGMTLVIAATGGADLSVGAVIAVTGASAARLMGGAVFAGTMTTGAVIDGAQSSSAGTPLLAAAALPLALAMILGLWNGILVSYGKVQPIAATLMLMITGRGLAQLITGGQIIAINHRAFDFIGGGWFLELPFPIFIVMFVFILAQVLTKKTALGLFIESVGSNSEASWYAGINGKAVKIFSFVFCGFCAGTAGLIICSSVKSADPGSAGLNMELDAVLASAIGGTRMAGGKFSLSGSLIGALLMQTLTTTIYTFGVPPESSLLFKALTVVLVCFLQSGAAARFAKCAKRAAA